MQYNCKEDMVIRLILENSVVLKNSLSIKKLINSSSKFISKIQELTAF